MIASEAAASMGRVRPRVLADVFAPVAELPVQRRLPLAELLARPGHAPAILPAQLASTALPAGRAARDALPRLIAHGLDRATLTALAHHRLADVVPTLPASWRYVLPAAAPAAVERHGSDAVTGQLTVGQIASWRGFGPGRVSAVVVAAVEAALQLADDDAEIDAPSPAITDDITVVLAHDASAGGGLRRQLEHLAAAAPADVGQACARILAGSAPARALSFLDDALAAAGDERDRGVFEHVVLELGPPVTRADIAASLGLGPERVRQLASQAADRVDRTTQAAPIDVRNVVATVSNSLGTASPSAAIDDLLLWLGFPPLPDTRSRLLLRMAGPYRPVVGFPGWISSAPRELVTETRRMLREDGGVRMVDHVAKELLSLGVPTEHVDGWLARQPVCVIDDVAVLTTGAAADVAERVLEARGRPLTLSELARWVPHPPADVEAALWRDVDRRFVVTGDGTLALADWGDDWGGDGWTADRGDRPGDDR